MKQKTRIQTILLITIIVLLITNFANASRFNSISKIKVGHYPTGVALDPAKKEVFVVNHGDNAILVISQSTNAIVKTINAGKSHVGIAYDAGKGEVFVTNSGENTVSVISDATNSVVETVTVGSQPWGIAYDSAKSEVFVANYGSNTVSVISDSTNIVTTTISVGQGPGAIVYDSGKSEIFVANKDDDTISVISDSSHTVVKTIQMNGKSVESLAYDSGKNEIFTANYNAGSVSVISDQTYTEVATIQLGEHGSNPKSLTYNPAKGEIYVSATHFYVISDSTNSVIEEVSQAYGAVVCDCTKNTIYATCENEVAVLEDTQPLPTPEISIQIVGVGLVVSFGAVLGAVIVAKKRKKTP